MQIEILILWVWGITFVSTLVRATLGFGNALVAMPLLAIIFLISLPAAGLAVLCGNRLNRSIPRGKFDRYVHLGLICIGIMLLIRTLSH